MRKEKKYAYLIGHTFFFICEVYMELNFKV